MVTSTSPQTESRLHQTRRRHQRQRHVPGVALARSCLGDAVEYVANLSLVEERNARHDAAAQRVLQEALAQGRRRERVLVAAAHAFGEQLTHRLAQHPLFDAVVDLAFDGKLARKRNETMVEERQAAL